MKTKEKLFIELICELKFTFSHIDRELIFIRVKPPEPEIPGSNPGGPAFFLDRYIS
jgi:hypothetical protein